MDEIDGLVVLHRIVNQQEQESQILPLADRIPSIDVVISSLKCHRDTINLLNTPNVFNTQEDLDAFHALFHCTTAEDDFWFVAYSYMIEAVVVDITSQQTLEKSRSARIPIFLMSCTCLRPTSFLISHQTMSIHQTTENCNSWLGCEYWLRIC